MRDDYEQRAEIIEVIARYCFAVDVRDIEALMALMTDDICYSWRGGRTVEGHEAVREYVLKSWAALGATLHSVSSPPLVRIDAEGAAVSLHYGHAEHAVVETGGLKRSAMAYVNRYRHVDGRWRITRRRADLIYSADAGTLDDAYLGRETRWDVETEHSDSILMQGWQDVRLAGGGAT